MKYNYNFDGSLGQLKMNFSIEAGIEEKELVFDTTERIMKRAEKALENPPSKISISKDSPDNFDVKKCFNDVLNFNSAAEIRYEFGNFRRGISRYYKNRLEKIEDPKMQKNIKKYLYDLQEEFKEVAQKIIGIHEIFKKENEKQVANDFKNFMKDHSESKKIEVKFEEANKKLHTSREYIHFNKLSERVKNDNILKEIIKDLIKDNCFKNEVINCIGEQKISSTLKQQLCALIDYLIEYPLFVLINLGRLNEDSEDKKNDKLCGYLRTIVKGLTLKSADTYSCIEMSKIINHFLKDLVSGI